MEEHNGKNSQNAGIKISYTGKKPKVQFSYPVHKKDSRTRGDMFFPVIMVWVIINLPLMIYLSSIEDLNSQSKYKVLNEYDKSNYVEFVEYYTQPKRVEYYYNYYNDYYGFLTEDLTHSLLFVLYLFLIPIFIYFPFKKFWDKFFPDYQAFLVSKKYRKFKPKDVQEGKENFYIELPIFTNVICDFNATKDFSRYLEEFEIKEYQFKYYKREKSKVKSKKKKKRKVRMKNEFIWYARWYFKKNPKKGFIEVIYK